MKWEANVYRFTFMGRSKAGNWYESQFRWFWTAYLMARFMAFVYDFVLPTKIVIRDAIRTRDGYRDEVQDSPYGIAWEVMRINED